MPQATPIHTLTLPTDLMLTQLPELQRYFLAEVPQHATEIQLTLLYGTQVDSAGLQFLLWLQQQGHPAKITVIVPPQHSLLTLLELYQLTPPFKVQITE